MQTDIAQSPVKPRMSPGPDVYSEAVFLNSYKKLNIFDALKYNVRKK